MRLTLLFFICLLLTNLCLADSFDESILKRELGAAQAETALQEADLLFEMGFKDKAWLKFRELNLASLRPEERARFFWLRGRLEWDQRRPDLARKNFRQVEKEAPHSQLLRRLYTVRVEFALAQDEASDASEYRGRLNELPDAEYEAVLATARILEAEGSNEAALSVYRNLVGDGGSALAQQLSLELARLLDKMNRSQEGWRLTADVLRKNLAAKREWLAAESFENLRQIRRADPALHPSILRAEIKSEMPRTRLGLRAILWEVYSGDKKDRQRRIEDASALALELDEPQIAALFASRRADFADNENDREKWRQRVYELASRRPVYDGSIWYSEIHPRRLRATREARSRNSNTQQFMDLADRSLDPVRRLGKRYQALSHSFLENDARRCLQILPVLMDELAGASMKNRQLFFRHLLDASSAGMNWSATPQQLQLGGEWETPVLALARGWLSKQALPQQRVLDALITDLVQAKLQSDRASVALAQENLVMFLAAVGREEEALTLADQCFRSFVETDNELRAAELEVNLLTFAGPELKDELVESLVTRYRGHEDYSVVGGVAISDHFRKTGKSAKAEDYVRRYLAAPSGRTQDSRRSYFFLELASIQRDRGDLQGSLKSLDKASQYQSLRGLPLARARTYLKLGQPQQVLKVLEQAPQGSTAARVQGLRLKSDALWALSRQDEAIDVDKQIVQELESFLLTHYHPELKEEILEQPLIAVALEELRQRRPDVELQLPAPEPLIQSPADEESLAETLERLKRRSPLARQNLKLGLAQIEKIRSRLTQQGAVIHLFPMEESLGMVVVTKDEAKIEELVVGSSWKGRLGELKALLTTPDSNPEELNKNAAKLGILLISPWSEELAQDEIYLLASGELTGFPFEVLPTSRPLKFSQLDLGRATAPWVNSPQVGLLLDGSRGLAGAKRELEQLSRLMPNLRVASLTAETSVLEEAGDLIHICSHGAPPNSKALVGKLLNDDDELTGAAISELPLRMEQLVVLSSCAGGVDPYARDNSLAHQFRAAGAGRVVASSWELDDQVAPIFFLEFYRCLQLGEKPNEALSKAREKVASEFPHPYYWGGVTLFQNIP